MCEGWGGGIVGDVDGSGAGAGDIWGRFRFHFHALPKGVQSTYTAMEVRYVQGENGSFAVAV